jgi:hypothetical protein
MNSIKAYAKKLPHGGWGLLIGARLTMLVLKIFCILNFLNVFQQLISINCKIYSKFLEIRPKIIYTKAFASINTSFWNLP